MPLIEDPKADEQVRAIALNTLTSAANIGKSAAQSLVPVDSGDLRSTIKLSEPRMTKGSIEVGIQAGGTAASGKIVDYAEEVEMRSPFLRSAVNAIAQGLRNV
jgi:hypothetical protein